MDPVFFSMHPTVRKLLHLAIPDTFQDMGLVAISGNNSVVNIYSDGTKKEDKKQDETPTQTTESAPDSKTTDLISEGVKNAASNAVRDYALGGIATVLGVGGLRSAYKNRQSIGESVSRFSTSARNSMSRFSTSAGHRLGRGSEYNGLDRPPPVGAAFEEVSEARTRAGSRAGSRAVSEASSRVSTDLQTGSRGLDNAALDARMDEHVRRIREQARPIEVSRTIPRRPPSIADENAPLLIGQPPLSARSNSSRSSSASSSSTRNLIHESPAAVRRARNSTNPVLEAEITLAPSPRARVSGIHEHSGVSTRNIRAQTGEPHSQLSQSRDYYRSDDKDYRRGQRHREKHDNTNRPRPLVEVLNPDSPYNQGYFGDALHEGKEGYHPREVKPGPKKR